MMPGRFTSFSSFESSVATSIENADRPKLMGLLFMRQEQEIASKSIVPSLGWFSSRSGEHIHFVLAGWTIITTNETTHAKTVWEYDNSSFAEAVKIIEENSSWRYSGGTELLLFTAQSSKSVQNTGATSTHSLSSSAVDFSNAISLHLDLLKDRKQIDSIERLFDAIFRFATKYDGDDPVGDLSFQEMRESLATGLSKVMQSFIPKESTDNLKYAAEFAVKDLSLAKQKPLIRIKTSGRQVGLPL